MLAEFDKKLRSDPVMQSRITLHRGDMTAFNLETTFDWIILPFRVFQALQNDYQRCACLLALRRHMRPNSRAVLSMFNPKPEILALWGQKGMIDFDIEIPNSSNRLRRIQNQISHDARTQVIITEHLYQVYNDSGVLEEYPDRLELGYLYPEQASNLFTTCGFFVEEAYGDYSFQPLQSDIKKEQIYILRLSG